MRPPAVTRTRVPATRGVTRTESQWPQPARLRSTRGRPPMTVTTQALAGAMGAPTLDDLASFDFTEEGFDDPLGIAMSWEEKQQQKKAAKEEAKP